MHFEPDENLGSITGAETVKMPAAMLGDALDQVRRGAGVERAVSRGCKNVNGGREGVLHRHVATGFPPARE
jgi:hypothetical protein